MADDTHASPASFWGAILSPSIIAGWKWPSIGKMAVLLLMGLLAYGAYANVGVVTSYVEAMTKPDPLVTSELRGVSKSLADISNQIEVLRAEVAALKSPAPTKPVKKR